MEGVCIVDGVVVDTPGHAGGPHRELREVPEAALRLERVEQQVEVGGGGGPGEGPQLVLGHHQAAAGVHPGRARHGVAPHRDPALDVVTPPRREGEVPDTRHVTRGSWARAPTSCWRRGPTAPRAASR